jgi:hypothetical protein
MVRRRRMRSVKLECLIFSLLLSPAVTLSAKDLSDYPLRVEILWSHWEMYNLNPGSLIPMIVHKVNGRGNVREGNTVHAFDFEYQGSTNIGSAPLNQSYLARWKKPQLELQILLPDIGHEGKYAACRMDTLVRKGVYVHSSQGVIEISQEDYAAGKPPPAAAAASKGPEPSATISKLSVSSNPDSAEIEVDGEFMGTTPSVLQLNVGPHTITLHKKGFRDWERKMVLVVGEIKLNADLDPETSK